VQRTAKGLRSKEEKGSYNGNGGHEIKRRLGENFLIVGREGGPGERQIVWGGGRAWAKQWKQKHNESRKEPRMKFAGKDIILRLKIVQPEEER